MGWTDLITTEPPVYSNGAGRNFTHSFTGANNGTFMTYNYIDDGSGSSIVSGLDNVLFLGMPSWLYTYPIHSEEVIDFALQIP